MGTYAKGRPSNATVDRVWPYQVEITVPGMGLGQRYGEMLKWLAAHAPPPQHGRRGGGRMEASRYAFKSREIAEAFRAEFGGELIHIEPRRRRGAVPWP